jgi:hypothetical protein
MFFPGSRYERSAPYQTTGPDGSAVTVVRPPLPPHDEDIVLLGFHPRRDGQELDAIADHYLSDATAFWRLCDVNRVVVPDALAARPMVGIPRPGA